MVEQLWSWFNEEDDDDTREAFPDLELMRVMARDKAHSGHGFMRIMTHEQILLASGLMRVTNIHGELTPMYLS
jgi:hypothetical protein